MTDPLPSRADTSNAHRASQPADAVKIKLFERVPDAARPYISLARLDRPIGIWLLVLPCWIGLAFSSLSSGLCLSLMGWALLFTLGAVAMRGAGCTWNDITDRDLDAGVARTAARPIPAGLISLKAAYAFLLVQLAIGFLVWLFLPPFAKLVALCALPLVALYPFMKRLTYWPQLWLGMTFNWGLLVAGATLGGLQVSHILLYLALILWTVAYDTIYALQDREDDALMGIKSTALLFGDHVPAFAFTCHFACAILLALVCWINGLGIIAALMVSGFLMQGAWQYRRITKNSDGSALSAFKSNLWAGLIVCLGFFLESLVRTLSGSA